MLKNKDNVINFLLEVPADDPDQRRRSRLLNILLLSIGLMTSLALVITILGVGVEQRDIGRIIPWIIVTLIGVSFTFAINRYVSGWLASWLFLSLLTLAFLFTDLPEQVVAGRTLYTLTIPVLMASVILRPYSSFIMAAIVSTMLNIVAMTVQLGPQVIPVLGFFAIALISWLAAVSLENALRDLRVINEELDQRVETRTAELKIANNQLQEEITERLRINQELEIARDRALEASRFKTEMLAKVSHELRTPLGAILGYAEMLQAGLYGELTAKGKEVAKKIIKRNHTLDRLVGDLLDQSQFETGAPRLKMIDFSIRDLADDVYALLEPTAEGKDIELYVEVDPNLPDNLFNDPDRLRQIMVNLGNNALKFTEEGEVRISIDKVDEAFWQVEVSDTGPGIPEHEYARIFEAFRQMDWSAARKYKGFGLGLSIVKQLTDIMDGEITLTSKLGHGSKFKIIFPLVLVKETTI